MGTPSHHLPNNPQNDINKTNPEDLLCLNIDYRVDWTRKQLQKESINKIYPHLIEPCLNAMRGWHSRVNTKTWRRLTRKNLVKEFNEQAPVLDYILKLVNDIELKEDEKVTILDLCSGFGYLAMTLSELLPKEKVRRIWLIDKAWPLRNQVPKEKNISWDHIYVGEGVSKWPIELETRRTNLTKSTDKRQLGGVCWEGRGEGPVVMLGIHLCRVFLVLFFGFLILISS